MLIKPMTLNQMIALSYPLETDDIMVGAKNIQVPQLSKNKITAGHTAMMLYSPQEQLDDKFDDTSTLHDMMMLKLSLDLTQFESSEEDIVFTWQVDIELSDLLQRKGYKLKTITGTRIMTLVFHDALSLIIPATEGIVAVSINKDVGESNCSFVLETKLLRFLTTHMKIDESNFGLLIEAIRAAQTEASKQRASQSSRGLSVLSN